MKRFRNYFCITVFVWMFLLYAVEAKAEEGVNDPGTLYALSAVLMDGDSGRILYEKNGDQIRAMASTTKIMTLILALEMADPMGMVEVSPYASGMPDVQLHINSGETYVLKDLLYSLMLESHNDSAVAIAEYVAESLFQDVESAKKRSKEDSKRLVSGFAEHMNAKARDLGCYDTHFVTPNGLDQEDEDGPHVTTARDLAQILRYCIKLSPQKDAFLEITRKASHHFSDITGKRSFSLRNHNAFLTMMDGALTGKTGFTSKAGYCYVGALNRDGKTYIAALLGCGWPNHKSYKWSDMRKLMNYGIEQYSYCKFDQIEIPLEALEPLAVRGGCGKTIDEIPLVKIGIQDHDTGQEEKGVLLRADEKIQVEWKRDEILEAPVEEGSVVGQIEYRVNDEIFETKLLVAKEYVPSRNFSWCMLQIVELLLDFT